MGHSHGGKQENNLITAPTFDFIRTLLGQASRKTTKTDFVTEMTQLFIDAGFLTAANLPVEVSQIRLYREESGNTNLVITDSVVGMESTSAGIGINLVSVASAFDVPTSKGQAFTISNIGTGGNLVSITTNGSDLINGQADIDIADGVSVTIFAKSITDWILI